MIVGAGAVGHHLSERFSAEGHEVVLVDTDQKKLRRLERDLNVMPVCGSGASARILEEAGIKETDLFVAVTDSDEVNLISCIISKSYNVSKRIARVRNEDFYGENASLNEKALGIDLLISPDQALSEEIIRLSAMPHAFESAEFADGQVVLLGYTIQEGNTSIGKTLIDLKGGLGVVVAIIREEKTIIPRGEDLIKSGDRIYFVVRTSDIAAIEKKINFTSRIPQKIFIIGGGIIGYRVARMMEAMKLDVKIVEADPQRCKFLVENLQRAVVLNCDGLNGHDLLDEGIDQADLIVAVTESDTTNILSSLLAKHHGAKKCMTRISRPDFIPLLGKLGIDVALSPRLVAANMILSFVRSGESVVSVSTLVGSDAEVVEIKVPDLEKFQRVPLKDLNFPKLAVLGAIVRKKKNKVIIPTGTTRIRPDDNLVIFATKGSARSIEDFFAG
jgi:trk system potassium uptake protein TrkA